jgi:ssDNA-binding Zn-finger/Zn-ribbon topoisomerase 1
MSKEMVMTWLNYYECPECNDTWQDEWDCQVDDDCPSCGCRHISPYESVDI